MKQYWLDMLLLVVLGVCLATGYLLEFRRELAGVLTVPGRTVRLWHVWSGYFATLGIVLHLVWHRAWIKAMTKCVLKGAAQKN